MNKIKKIGKLASLSLFCLCCMSPLQGLPDNKKAESLSLPSINTLGLEPKLKRFLDRYYQENYPEEALIQTVQSMQFIGSYSINNQPEGQIKIIKKRPNKYKSKIKNQHGSEQITIFDGEKLYSGIRAHAKDVYDWKLLDATAPKNSWIQFDQHFDSLMLSPKDPNKEMKLLKAYRENNILIQPIRIEHNSGYAITHYVDVSDNLIQFTKVELQDPSHPNYNQFEVHYEAYKSINGIQFPTILISKVSPELTIRNEFTDIKLNLGVSNFIFEPSDY